MTSLPAVLTALSLAFQGPASTPAACPPKTTTCAHDVCVPLGQTCPSAAEIAVDAGEAPAPAVAPAAPVTDWSNARPTFKPRTRSTRLEPLADWQVRRLRVGFGLALPGVALLSHPLFALAATDLSAMPQRSKNVMAVFGVFGGVLLLAGLIAPRLMQRRSLTCNADTCSIALRF